VLPVLPKPQNGSGARNGPALSSAEDKEMKKKLRNRESALAARERKKQKMLELERRVSELGRENSELKVENCALRGTLSTVMQKYGAPQKEIDDTLKTTQTLTVKKEPVDVKAKPVGRKNTVARISQKVISLGPNERKPRDVNHSVQVKQEAPEITLTDTTHDTDDTQSPSTIMLPKISTVQRSHPAPPSNPSKHSSKVILTSNIMFSPKKSNTIYTHSNNIQPPNYDDNTQQINQHPDDHHVNALDMLELPVVKQEPQDYTGKTEVIPESPHPPTNTMVGSPMETPSPSSSERYLHSRYRAFIRIFS
jgi:regulator of replication initiation timing